ncbi:2-methylisocitrate lyase [Staphylotrichum tortipilum]|uniref:2-methylisocitrate lyase n=1 Tax=Staphylotrichum tortipilum TaxID=2831512 RepID=A0AAN6MAG8_9PEZI|nr:2-methylisocitrate lyase [Staphylotrichum longicolle]
MTTPIVAPTPLSIPNRPPLSTLSALATSFKALHQPPNPPLRLANAYDATSARLIASHPSCVALATASFALALTAGTSDPELTLDQNLALVAPIAAVAHEVGLPLSVDVQDGYGERLEEVVRRVILEVGAVGANLEDSERQVGGRVMEVEEAVERVERAVKVAREVGVGDFVVNARSDAFLRGGTIEESVERGRRFLEAGATTVYVFWPAGREMVEEDVRKVVEGLGGRVNIQPRRAGGVQMTAMTAGDVARLGAARISVGPQLYHAAAAALRAAVDDVFGK